LTGKVLITQHGPCHDGGGKGVKFLTILWFVLVLAFGFDTVNHSQTQGMERVSFLIPFPDTKSFLQQTTPLSVRT
jgi:hypothetical protein